MVEIIILTLTFFILAAISGWVNRHSRTTDRLCRKLDGFIARATKSIAWAIMGGK